MIIAAGAVWFYAWRTGDADTAEMTEDVVATAEAAPTTYTKSIDVVPESTYSILMEEAGVPASVFMAIYGAAEDVYDLANVRVGRTLDLIYDRATDEMQELVYKIDSEEELHVRREGEEWVAERVEIAYEINSRVVEGTITTSLYESALAQGLDERAIIALADVFQWTIDFAMDVRVGDTYKFVFEERFRDGEYVMPGRVLAARYVNAGTEFRAFHFEEGETRGYFDENADSVQKIFLKAPVAFKYISSGFTTGRRYVSAFNVSTGHRAIDYAAAYGTPIRAVGDGVVSFSGWSSVGYGNLVSIRHNGTYSTNYAHMSRRAVSRGQRVSQGQTIGYVGSTGFSTGPHLHYEMVKYGTKINPLREEFPSDAALPEEHKEAFTKIVERYSRVLD